MDSKKGSMEIDRGCCSAYPNCIHNVSPNPQYSLPLDQYRRLVKENAALKAKLEKAVKGLKYCAVEPGRLQPENNKQHVVALNTLAEIEAMRPDGK